MVRIKKLKITDKIFVLKFKNQYEITSTFLRFQEHYESPKFRRRVFDLDEYKKWYASINGKFSYYKDWNGFNIPSYVLRPFYDGKFNPLSEKEQKLLNLFKNERGNFYIVGVHSKIEEKNNLLKHEIAHGLFYTMPHYKKKILKEIKKFSLNHLKKELLSTGGYSIEVINDELQAYSLSSSRKLKSKIPKRLKRNINLIFNEELKSVISK